MHKPFSDAAAPALVHRLAPLALLALLLALSPAHAAEADGLHLSAPDAVNVYAGETTQLTFTVTGYTIPESRLLLASAVVDDEANWNVRVSPGELIINPGDTRQFVVTVEAPRVANPESLQVGLGITAVNGTEATRLQENTSVQWIPTNLVLGRWDNPLPAPMDGEVGTFFLNVLAWVVIAAMALLVLNPFVRLVAKRTDTDVDDKVVKIITWPTFILVTTFGIKQSLESFALPGWLFVALDRVWSVVLVVVITYIVYRIWSDVVVHLLRVFTERSRSSIDDRLYPVFEKAGGILIILGGFVYFLDSLGANMAYFAAGGAAVSLVVAFAAQDTLSNFFSGIHLLIDQPFKEGDDIMLESGEVCRVEHIGLRSTRLYHRANHEFFVVPNNSMANARITNMLFPDQHYKMKIAVGVAYGSDIDLVTKLLMDCARDHPLVMSDEGHEPWVWFMDFGASSLDFKLYVWVEDLYVRWAVADDLRRAIDAKFREHGIEIPFPQRVIWQGEATPPSDASEVPGPSQPGEVRPLTSEAGDAPSHARPAAPQGPKHSPQDSVAEARKRVGED